MAGETVITVVGNLTADPELRYTQNGLAVANFTIASTPRTFDRQANEWKDGDALFLRASVWREFAEHVAGSLTKGSRVIAQGRLRQRSYQDREGQQRTSIELEVDEIGPSLRYATAQITRAAGGGGGRGQVGGGNSGGGGQQGGGNGGWNNNGGGNASAGGQSDEPWSPQGGQQGGGNAQSNDVWSTPGGNFDDETPF
ncbi:single-stranded DNA-binding protein [Curtobacterium sp. MCJR17_020]|uniref:single-stranded DNA-binding protein n=1 Tax=Curtobacterium sp. MCJR17_020 TaxID=2175619 RepID=UPI000DAA8829|nr:single-stranded DNA-binding protein [Curtobacterium sp. MCJR17_020]WIE72159.1 single-stranded DNA-binding protein [Curtobacterium sp. MCJR17_020]